MTERVDLMGASGHRALYRQRTLCHHDNRGILAGESALDEPAHFLDRKRAIFSGIRITLAPPAMPECKAIQPE